MATRLLGTGVGFTTNGYKIVNKPMMENGPIDTSSGNDSTLIMAMG